MYDTTILQFNKYVIIKKKKVKFPHTQDQRLLFPLLWSTTFPPEDRWRKTWVFSLRG